MKTMALHRFLNDPRYRLARPLFYGLLSLLATALPLRTWISELPLAKSVYGEPVEALQLFALAGSLLLIGFGAVEFVKRKPAGPREFAPVLAALITGFFYLALFNLFSIPSWDYQCYQEAAVKILSGQDPYAGCYLYPPLLAQVMAFIFSLMDPAVFPAHADQLQYTQMTVFYLYQVGQFYLVMASYWLIYLFARGLELEEVPAAVVAAGLLVLGFPALSTFRENQVNFGVLVTVLAALLLLRRRPFFSGAALSLGIHLKLYPAIILAPWTWARKWRPVLAALAGFGLVLAIQTRFGSDLEAWRRFLHQLLNFPDRNNFQNNSISALIYSCFELAALLVNAKIEGWAPVIRMVSLAAKLGLGLWFAWRLLQREKIYRLESPATNEKESADLARLFGHALDALALSLLITPVAWAHHYLLAYPLLIFAGVKRGRAKPWLFGLAAFLILAVPNFDFFLLSDHRLAGLIILLVLTAPGKIRG